MLDVDIVVQNSYFIFTMLACFVVYEKRNSMQFANVFHLVTSDQTLIALYNLSHTCKSLFTKCLIMRIKHHLKMSSERAKQRAYLR